ncbi:NACHT domain-containing protein [Oscillatoria sp. FACHB-1406]|uniref:NACHT domain-containing protein n=1 Tax=Oscillatoria sp. FACHB-1406 TaxID=2692846 RepID=UPI00168623BA|nr:NACHT domain-containing protein [Oscillatoria sp. FACHB-1406]MBD2578934.1 NACHT domain-containing protein [Oscillatoria sp. FACHB-1406]
MTSEYLSSSVEISGGTVQGFIQENHGTVTQNFIYQVSELLSSPATSTELPLTQTEYRQRKVLLGKVKEYWIEGVLNNLLQTQATIELSLEKRLDAVERPFTPFDAIAEESRQILPAGTSATEFFQSIGEGRTLLILGEPGAGKTITLLKLTQNLIASAEENLSRLIPVVLNLSSWGNKKQTIAEWLIEELYSKYQVSKSLGKKAIEQQQLLLLLDGLDEVNADLREACVQAINQFMQEHGQTEMVVTSRIADYESLSNRLQLLGAIFIRSLTPEQIESYLESAGEQLKAVKTLLKEDTVLQELAKSPLTLSVMTLAYQGKNVEELRQIGALQERRQNLFEAYIKRMFQQERIGKSSQYNPPYQHQQTTLWLNWLAQRMSQASQTIFLIEQMQPTWLQSWLHKIVYKIGSSLFFVFSSLLFSVILALFFSGLTYPFLFLSKYPIKFSEILKMGLLKGLNQGIIIGGVYGLYILLSNGEIQLIESLQWSWKEAKKSLPRGIILSLLIGIIIGLVFGVSYELIVSQVGDIVALPKSVPMPSLMAGLYGGLLHGVSAGIIYCLSQGFKGAKIEAKTFPNQGIWESAKSAVFLGLIGSVITAIVSALFALVFTVIIALQQNIVANLIGALIGGGVYGLFLGLIFGGITACIQHFTLRIILYFNNSITWNYAHFLDYAADRIFLQKVGGSYIFIHRMLMEHFASNLGTYSKSQKTVR